ncbi:hypothetical protein [Streptomyces sp. GS7]|uniref:hypothetical protein n=1 Tax=Streptomyces sp. GS7 TaxID=2692234 RepID=UPI0013164FF2|nr:hypothetical protein [Streptomyces sp. GS7]QHC22292.1 hypothetical protein GR130_13510 [Streptomyces sp. GS7]
MSANEKALLKRLMEETEQEQTESEPEKIADQVDAAGSEEIIVFRGNAEAFKKAFGLTAAESPQKNEEPAKESTEETAEAEGNSERKKEPKAPSRSRYFG